MPCPFHPINPPIRLNVFISSAQRDENGFKWGEVRGEVKNHLEECPYIVPFIIDVVASEISSTQLFQYEVLKADIVVMLIKGEVRPGTSTEFATATKNKKPLLVYFLKDDNPSLEVEQLRKAVQAADYCTYCDIDDFDNIAQIVRNDVISNVIRYYQYDHFNKSAVDTATVELSAVVEEPSLPKHSTPTKTTIGLFSSSYAHIFKLLGINGADDKDTPKSPLHTFGMVALDWLVTGAPLECEEEILKLIENLKDSYDSTDWLIKRWDAIRFELSGNFEQALIAEKEALSLAKAANLPTWIINDILIDCRNLEDEVHNQKGEWVVDSEVQKELTNLETIVYLPVLDRYLTDIYSALSKEEFKFQTASPNTIFFGTNIGGVINNVENYFFSAVLYGSFTHMVITREILTMVLYRYDDITKRRPLLLDCLKILVVKGDAKQFKKIIDHKWDDAYAEIVSHADEIWALTDKTLLSHQNSIKQAVIAKLGLYLSDSVFEKVEKFLLTIAPTIYWGNSEDYFESINQNMRRLNCESVMRMLTEIIDEQRFHLGGKLANIILQMKLDNVKVETQRSFCDVLKAKISFIVKNGGTPQIIAALASQNPETFSVLSGVPENGLVGVEKTFYDINMGKGNWTEVLTHEIGTAKNQFEVNKEGTYTGFFELPYAMIKMVIREHYDSSMDEVIEQQFFPLCTEVLKSQAVAKVKNDCIDGLCDVLAFNTSLRTKMPKELSDAISAIEVEKVGTIFSESKGAFACRVLMVKIISGASSKEELLEWCVGYSKKETNERIALAECIEQFIVKVLSTDQIDATVLSIVMQCFDDEHYVVRRKSCNCFVLLLDTKYRDLAERKLCEAAIDPSHYVRSQVLNLCKSEKIKIPEIKNELIGILATDANYAIRIGCE